MFYSLHKCLGITFAHTHTHRDLPQVILMLTRQLNIPHARRVFAIYISQIFAKIVAVFKQLSTGRIDRRTDRQMDGQSDEQTDQN